MKEILTVLLFVTFSFAFCRTGLSQVENLSKINRDSEESGYYYAFTEATKLYIFGDYQKALMLYNECLKYHPESASILYQIAQIYLRTGDIQNAKKFAKRAYSVEKTNTWIATALANIYDINQQPDSALIIYKAMGEGKEFDMSTLYAISGLCEKVGKNEEALKYLDRIETKIGVSKEVAISKSRIYSAMGDSKNARIQLFKALSISNEDYIVIGMIAEYYRNLKMADSAYFYYNKIIREYKSDAGVCLSYGEFLLEQNQVDSATNWFLGFIGNREIELSVKARYLYNVLQDSKTFALTRPVIDTVVTVFLNSNNQDIRIISLYSDVEFRLGNYRKSAGALKSIVKEDVNNYVAWEQLIYCQNFLNRPDSVIHYGLVAVNKFKTRPVPYLFLGSAYYQKKLYINSIEFLEKGLQFADPDALRLEFFTLLAENYNETKEYEKADSFFESALKIDKSSAVINNNYAYYLAVRGERLSEAKKMSKISISAEPGNSTYLDTYAWVLFKMKKLKEAKKYLLTALEKGGSENAEILNHLGDVLFALKENDEAYDMWIRARNIAEEPLLNEINGKILSVGKER